MLVEHALRKAYENGDMTRKGVFDALYSFDDLDFMGIAPSETYTGSTSDQVQRAISLYRPSQEDLLSGGSGVGDRRSRVRRSDCRGFRLPGGLLDLLDGNETASRVAGP